MADTPTHLLSLLARGTDDEHLGDSHGLAEVLVEDMLPDMHAPWRMGVIEALLPGCVQPNGAAHLMARTPAELVALRESWHEITSMIDPEARRISHGVDSWSISCPYTDGYIAQIAQDPGFPVVVSLHLNSYDELQTQSNLFRVNVNTNPLLSPVDGTDDGTLAEQAPAGPASLLACAAALQQHTDRLAADVARPEGALLRTTPADEAAPAAEPADDQDNGVSELGARLGNTDVYLSWDGGEDPGLLCLTLAHAGTTDLVRSWHDHLAPYMAAVNGTTTESHLKSFSYGPWGLDVEVHPDQNSVVVFIEDHAGDQREFELLICDLRRALINAEVPGIIKNDQDTTA